MALKLGNNFKLMANSQTPAELKNCKLENPSHLFGSLAQYLGSDKRRVLSVEPLHHIFMLLCSLLSLFDLTGVKISCYYAD